LIDPLIFFSTDSHLEARELVHLWGKTVSMTPTAGFLVSHHSYTPVSSAPPPPPSPIPFQAVGVQMRPEPFDLFLMFWSLMHLALFCSPPFSSCSRGFEFPASCRLRTLDSRFHFYNPVQKRSLNRFPPPFPPSIESTFLGHGHEEGSGILLFLFMYSSFFPP